MLSVKYFTLYSARSLCPLIVQRILNNILFTNHLFFLFLHFLLLYRQISQFQCLDMVSHTIGELVGIKCCYNSSTPYRILPSTSPSPSPSTYHQLEASLMASTASDPEQCGVGNHFVCILSERWRIMNDNTVILCVRAEQWMYSKASRCVDPHTISQPASHSQSTWLVLWIFIFVINTKRNYL